MSKKRKKDIVDTPELVKTDPTGGEIIPADVPIKDNCDIMPLMPMTEAMGDVYRFGRIINKSRDSQIISAAQDPKNGLVIYKNTTFQALDEKKGQITKKSASGTSIVGIENTDLFAGYNGTNLRFFHKVMAELGKQAIIDGKRIPDVEMIYISMQDLIDLGIANSDRSARGIFSAGAELLKKLTIRGVAYEHGEEIASVRKWQQPFTGGRESLRVGGIEINQNSEMDWDIMTHRKMAIPNFYYRLSGKTARVCHLIFAQCRRNIQKRKFRAAESHIKIKMMTIHQVMGLPDPKETSTPSRHIKGVIEAAIKKIQDEYEKDFHDKELELLIQSNKHDKAISGHNINEYLKFCFLRVKIRGSLRELIQKVGGVKRRRRPPIKVDGEVGDATADVPKLA